MSINGNRIVGPIEGIDCVLAARTFARTLDTKQNRVIYTYVDYPGAGLIWIPKGFMYSVQNMRHVSVNIDFETKTFSSNLLDLKLQTHSCIKIGNPNYDEFESIGHLTGKNNHVHVSSDKPDNDFSVENSTQGKLFAGQWYIPTHGGIRLKLRAAKISSVPSLDSQGLPTTYFRNFDPTETEMIDAEISFIPYSTEISIFGSNQCTFTEDKTLAMQFFDGWATRNPNYKQSGCIGYLRNSSKNCLFIGSLKPPGEHGHFDQEKKRVGCNQGYGYQIDESCGTHTLGNCDFGICARTHDTEGFKCLTEAKALAPIFVPDSLQESSHSRGGTTKIIILISIFLILILLVVFAKFSNKL